MAITKLGGFRAGVDREFDKTFILADGLVATDGVQLSSIASFGTLAVQTFSKVIDPGYTVRLDRLQVNLNYRLTNMQVDSQGSYFTYWTMQSEYGIPSGGGIAMAKGTAINVSGTYTGGLASYVSGSYGIVSLSGYVPVASIPYAPFTVAFTCRALRTGGCIVQIENSSSIRLIGAVIPGT